jgi:hypothetical protein
MDRNLQVMLGKLVAALRPGPYDTLDEATLNAAIALVASINARTELEAVLAVQIAPVGSGTAITATVTSAPTTLSSDGHYMP